MVGLLPVCHIMSKLTQLFFVYGEIFELFVLYNTAVDLLRTAF